MSNSFFKIITDNIKYWYIHLIVWILLVLFGFLIVLTPLDSYITLTFLFSVSFIITWCIDIFFYFSNRKVIDNWWWNFIFWILSLFIWVFLITNPWISMATLPYVVWFTLIFKSVSVIIFSIDLKRYRMYGWKNLMFIWILWIISSFLIILNPVFAWLTIVGLTWLAFMTIGISQIYLSCKLKKINDTSKEISWEIKSNYEKVKSDFETKVIAKIK